MAEQTFTFHAGEHEIQITLESPKENNVLLEQLNPWSDKQFASLIPVELFEEDIRSLLPDHVEEDLDKTLYPRLVKTLTDHAKKFGTLADADYCTYLNYFYLIRHHLALKTGAKTISTEDQKGAMLGFYQWLKDQGLPLEETKFRSLC